MSVIEVKNTTELGNALAAATPGTTVHLATAIYQLTQPLTVPDGVALVGDGYMQGDHWMNPAKGLTAGTFPTIRAQTGWVGDILSLGDGAELRGLMVEDVAGRIGNLVAVVSRAPADRISAKLTSCELVNPNPSGVVPPSPRGKSPGPSGRGLAIITRNPVEANPLVPHEGAMLSVQIEHCVFRSPGNGWGIFAVNFAPRGRIYIRLNKSTVGGGIDASGGVSRPSPVVGAETIIHSSANQFRSDGATPAGIGLSLNGGACAPLAAFVSPYTNGNTLILESKRDRIAGFVKGVHASGGWRPVAQSGPVAFNCADLDIEALTVNSTMVDLEFVGADSSAPDVAPGDDNHLRVTLRGIQASGPRSNKYGNSAAAFATLADPGKGNRLEMIGSPPEWLFASGLDPAPSSTFFLETDY